MKARGRRRPRGRVLTCPSVAGDLEQFSALHRSHGELIAEAGRRTTATGYRLQVACPCGVVFERWVTPEERLVDLPRFVRWKDEPAR